MKFHDDAINMIIMSSIIYVIDAESQCSKSLCTVKLYIFKEEESRMAGCFKAHGKIFSRILLMMVSMIIYHLSQQQD